MLFVRAWSLLHNFFVSGLTLQLLLFVAFSILLSPQVCFLENEKFSSFHYEAESTLRPEYLTKVKVNLLIKFLWFLHF